MEICKKCKESYHHNDLRNACIEKGVEMIARNGHGSLSLRSLAKELGVSHGAPYKHFKNKSELLIAIMEQSFSLFRDSIRNGYQEGIEEAHQLKLSEKERKIFTFKNLGRSYFNFAIRFPNHYRFMFSQWDEDIILCPEIHEVAHGTFDFITHVIEDMQKDGLVVDVKSQDLAFFVWSSIHGYMMLKLNQALEKMDDVGFSSEEKLLDVLFDSIVRGISR